MQRILLLTLVLSGCIGCTTIEIIDRNGAVQIERRFGIAEINVAPDAGVITARVSSLGYVSSPVGHSLGFTSQSITSSDDACRVIVWVDSDVDRFELEERLKTINSACLVEN